MRMTQYFIPTLKETPAEAQIASHQLMLRAGMVHQEAQGIYSWLPMGLRVLKKIENIVREEQDRAGCLEVLMPTLQPADIWQKSGRLEAYGSEMLRITDRHQRELLYSPTNEEMITQIFTKFVKSYKDFPKMFYQIQWKFRDEIRPRFGVMRGREFLMKDNYSFDIDFEGAKKSYDTMFETYLRTYKRMGLKPIPVRADPGAIGGNLSHEFCILAETGESKLYYDPRFESSADLDIRTLQDMYAATDEEHDPAKSPLRDEELKTARGIEVGHIFYFGTKYSEAFGAYVNGPSGERVLAHSGSYGIGISRLVGAIIESSHDDKGIIWPEAVAPYQLGIVNLKPGHEVCENAANKLYEELTDKGVEVLYDNRDARMGVKLADMDLIGIPWQIIIGPKGIEKGIVELKQRATGATQELSLESAQSTFYEKRQCCA
jgi:prolyl-tRNA synthetase